MSLARRCALGALLFAPATARSQATFEELSAMWKRAQYDSVAAPLIRHRNAAPTNGGLRVDYMIATSLCRSARDDYRHKGKDVSEYVLEQYGMRVDDQVRSALSAERTRCRDATAQPVSNAPVIVQIERIPLWPAGVSARHAKGFFFLCKTDGTGSESGTIVTAIPDSVYFARRVSLDQPGLGERRAKERLGPLAAGFRAKRVGRFIVAVAIGAPSATEARIAEQLEPYVAFYDTTFRFNAPSQFITIYAVDTPEMLARVSGAIYKEKPPANAIGYSNVADLSMIAVTNFGREGTMMHELMHLVLRSAMIDPPDWFDEGLAALYEVSRPDSSGIRGLPNWRGDFLANMGDNRPKLADVLASAPNAGLSIGWQEIAGPARDATARYFLLYLQERGVLAAAVRAIRERPPAVALDDSTGRLLTPGLGGQSLIEQFAALLHTDRDAMLRDYDVWMKKTLPVRPERRC